MKKIGSLTAWLYLLPAILFLGVFMVYPLFDVFVYSFEEGYNSASQTYFGTGLYNYSYVLHDPYFLQAVKNTFILVIITVPLSTGLALLISVGLTSIRPLRNLFQTIYFLPYVTNTLAVGLVFMILFKKTAYSRRITLPMISPMIFYLVITGFIGAFKAYSDAVALFGTNLNAAEMNTIVGYVYDMLYGDSGGYPSYASAAAIILFAIVLTITSINLLVNRRQKIGLL